jgi:hypothetical protein
MPQIAVKSGGLTDYTYTTVSLLVFVLCAPSIATRIEAAHNRIPRDPKSFTLQAVYVEESFLRNTTAQYTYIPYLFLAQITSHKLNPLAPEFSFKF